MNLIYTIAYGEVCNHRVPLMVRSLRDLGRFDGDIVVFSDQDKPIDGAAVVHKPQYVDICPIMALRWRIGQHLNLKEYEHVAMIDTDVVAIKPVTELFQGDPDVIRVAQEHPDGRRTSGNTPWSIEGVPMDSSKPFHNCGTVFGHSKSWNRFSGLMWALCEQFKPVIAPPYPWIDQQILNHIERHSLFPIQTLPQEWVFLCRRMQGVSPQTKMVHCIPGGNEKVQLMHLAYTLAQRIPQNG